MRIKKPKKLSAGKKRHFTRYALKFLTTFINRRVKHEGEE